MREMCSAERKQLDFEETERRVRAKNEPWQQIESYALPYVGKISLYSRWGVYAIEVRSNEEFGKELNSKRYQSIDEARGYILKVVGTQLRVALSAVKDESALREFITLKKEPQLSTKSKEEKL